MTGMKQVNNLHFHLNPRLCLIWPPTKQILNLGENMHMQLRHGLSVKMKTTIWLVGTQVCRDMNTIELHIQSWNWEKGGSMWERCVVPWEDMKMVTSPNLPISDLPAIWWSSQLHLPLHLRSQTCQAWAENYLFSPVYLDHPTQRSIPIPYLIPSNPSTYSTTYRCPCCALLGALYSFAGRTLPLYKYGREWKNFKTCSSWAGGKTALQFWANKVQEESPKIALRASKTGNKMKISLFVPENPNTYRVFVVSRQVQSFFRVMSMETMHRWCYNIVYRVSYIVHRTLCIVYRTS